MKHKFYFWNNLLGWFAFLLSASIYLFTLEPTVSFWDCGEFLSCTYKLEVCHAPGNPLFLLIGRLVSLFAAGKNHIAVTVNASSAIASGFTILFLYWTISWFGRKILPDWASSRKQQWMIAGAGFIGAMSYAVSDSFWFSAVETEVYAMSSLFMAVIFWCITRWEEQSAQPSSGRWLMLIAYLLGLGIGIHLLCLLSIPAIVVMYWLQRYPVTRMNVFKSLLLSLLCLGFVLYLIPFIPKICSWFELLAVNGWGMPFNTGYLMGGLVILAFLVSCIFFSIRKRIAWLQHTLVYITLVILGYSTYGVIIIRSHDNPPIDMNNPEDPFTLQYYLNREQYGKRDLIYGPSFASPVSNSKEKSNYARFNGKYIPNMLNPEYVYDENTLMPFPRMGENRPEDADAYKQWVDFKGKPYVRTNENGQQGQIMLPTFGENLTFFFRYQLGYMYFRYFMWNFAGRQNDILGHGGKMYGNWISGIPFIDNARLGPQQKLPASLRNNRGRNTYFLLPLLLGIAGLLYHYRRHRKSFLILLLLFLFTGIAIVIFLNEVPIVPRERDYVYVGSFYAFSIWIGLGVMALSQWLEKWLKSVIAVPLAIAASLTVPLVMVFQNFDDHNRSGRYAVLEYARNYLESCEPNAILFTSADNDTYPLWYAQEVEGIRRDIRIVLLPYLSADWYVNELRKPFYDKPGLPFSIG